MIELFYDLFFVANLATFTANHEIVNLATLKDYLGFFTILWFTWFETSLFDVRFSSDSVLERVCKAISFGVMTGLAATGAEFDTSRAAENSGPLRAMSMILMTSRIAMAAQYGVILWFVKGYRSATVPLGLTILATFLTAMVFLGTSFDFYHQSARAYIAWYVYSCCEAAAVIAIACWWPVIGFKHTHLVERVGLLSLIIMGEGVLGMSKSISTIFLNSSSVTASDIGVVIAAVLLTYFIWVLYFDQIEHDRFGAIRQQIWALLHFPLHVAILLTVEGSALLILWNIIGKNLLWLIYHIPMDATFTQFIPDVFNDPTSLITYLNDSISQFETRYKKNELQETYDYQVDFQELGKITAPFGTTTYNDEAGPICSKIWLQLFSSAFTKFGIEPHVDSAEEDLGKIGESYGRLLDTVFDYFYISAGSFLVVLAVMYTFGKVHKTRGEYVSILIRFLFGAGVALGCLSEHVGDGINYLFSPWHVPVVVLSYFIGALQLISI
ncbi:hypothetical protein H2200_001689 [Cladophialophora chaetospira]|uniref:Low temperature requirement A n=1 Tax=Cladophialophora chaetospira TaxID=386627 RepID=A0AA38XLC6_9EURO|nr:hypothetical protein H2200_001689 [Cladophialophora chaetospira]